ncbi:MAG: 3-oxoacyl-[acyl-carrier-protein] reductase [Bacteroidota bacterium]|nr:3-oxoacyl-[acyl-carrier-protein] reductase [Bacteroidota bacterium]
MKLLEGKTVLITGGSRGIGKGIVKVLVENGANVAFTYASSSGPALELSEKLNSNKTKCFSYKSDASVYSDCEKLIQDVLNDLGNIDVLINNAGITKDNLLLRMSEEDYVKVMDVNMKSVFNMTKAIQRTFLKNKKGSIINMSSVVGVKGNAGQSNYAASKAAIIGFSKSIALELGSRNIRCNVIAPGFIKTEMTDKLSDELIHSWNENIPLKRPGESEDVANLCLFLASDLSNYITGQVINIDGGLLT